MAVNNDTKAASVIASGTSPGIVVDPASLLAAVVDSCEDAIISKDLNGTVTSWNQAAVRIFGYTDAEIIGQSILCIVPDDLHEQQAEILARIGDGERIERYQTRRRSKRGDIIQVSLTLSPIRDLAGRVVGVSSIAHDISQQKRGEEERFRLAAIVNSSDDAILSMDLEGIVTSWNRAATRMYGYTADEIVGQSILELIPQQLHTEEDIILRKLRAGERIDHYETTRVKKNGESVEVSLGISPIEDDQGRVIGISKTARDISLRKQMERLLIQSEKLAATGRMAATIAHEINNPLESVVNLIFLARQNANSKTGKYLETAEKEIERISHIARQTLGYYRDTGKPTELYLHELIQEVLSVYQTKLHGRNITVECHFDKCSPVQVKKGEMIQVVSNIIVNSIDAMPQGGLLHIGLKELADEATAGVRLTIRDRGTGIEEKYLDRVFEPFFSTKGELGTGIGLWVTRQLVENHGGHISMASTTRPGESGTTVWISLPFASPYSNRADDSAGSTPPESRGA